MWVAVRITVEVTVITVMCQWKAKSEKLKAKSVSITQKAQGGGPPTADGGPLATAAVGC